MCSQACECDPSRANLELDGQSKCRKCGSKPFIILDKVHIECTNCFLESCNRKIRSTIGKSKLLRNNDSILLAYSGGPSSAALLDLVKNSNEYDARREQKFRPSILHVDTQSLIEPNFEALREHRAQRLAHVLNQVRGLYPDWPLYWTTVEMTTSMSTSGAQLFRHYNSSSDLASHDSHLILENRDAHRALFAKLDQKLDLTDRQERICNYISDLINTIAGSINSTLADTDKFKFVFTASSATQLANDLLVNVILGHGATANSTVSICDRRSLVPILRPMRDFSKKEVAFYLRARDLAYHLQPDLLTFAQRKASIQTVTEAFLSKLYEDYPATYSTLLRTGNKLQD